MKVFIEESDLQVAYDRLLSHLEAGSLEAIAQLPPEVVSNELLSLLDHVFVTVAEPATGATDNIIRFRILGTGERGMAATALEGDEIGRHSWA